MKTLMQLIAKRAKEPSTMAGIAALAMAVGIPLGVTESVLTLIAGAAGLAAVVMPEKK